MYYGYVYITTNIQNKKVYIGQHKKSQYDSHYFGSGTLLLKAINKYGKENFKNEVICFCNNKEYLDKMEKFFIKYYKSQDLSIGYNLEYGGQGGDITDYLKENGKYESWHNQLIGKNNPMYESGKRGIHPKGMLGKHQSDEYKNILRDKMLNHEYNPMNNGKVIWGETHEHPRGMKNHSQTNHQKDVASKTHRGVKKPEGFGDKVSQRMKGVPKTPESILKRQKTIDSKPLLDIVCVNCGSHFKARNKTAMYCSNICARRYRANLNCKKDK